MTADATIYDLSITSQALDSDDSLKTLITTSLLSWARAQGDDVVPDPNDLKGWWGDTYASVPGDNFGSRIWLLIGQPMTPANVALFVQYTKDALQWLVDDKVVTAVEVEAEVINQTTIGARIGVRRTNSNSLTWLDIWEISVAS